VTATPEQNRRKTRAYRERCRAEGRCYDCGLWLDRPRATCSECAARRAERRANPRLGETTLARLVRAGYAVLIMGAEEPR
jgi:uncharacterized OB-fold protein